MDALLNIAWFVWLMLSLAVVFHFVGMTALVNMFPEGRRPWQLPAQWCSLANFAACVLLHPF